MCVYIAGNPTPNDIGTSPSHHIDGEKDVESVSRVQDIPMSWLQRKLNLWAEALTEHSGTFWVAKDS